MKRTLVWLVGLFSATAVMAASIPKQLNLDEKLVGKTHVERVNMKSDAIVQAFFESDFTDQKTDIAVHVQKIEKIEGGIQIFARGWKNGQQLGFGSDGTIDIERFRFFDPRVLVDDDNGTIVRSHVTENGQIDRRKLRIDPVEATKQALADAMRITGRTDTLIVVGKVGNTTDTYYPDGDPESTTVDGHIVNDPGSSTWSTVHDATDGTAASDTSTDFPVDSGKDGGGNYFLRRALCTLDTSAIPDTNAIASAVMTLWPYSRSNGSNDGTDYITTLDSSPASNTAVSAADFDQVGDAVSNPTKLSNDVDISGLTLDAYNDWTLNATGISKVSKVGITKFGFRMGNDTTNTAYAGAGGTENRIIFRSADTTGTTSDPKLTVVHAAAGVNPSFILF